MIRILVTAFAIGLSALPTFAVSFYVTPDVPVDRSGSTVLPWEIVRNDSGTWGSELALPDGTHLSALHRMCGGDWLLSVDSAADLDGTTYDPRDVVRFDGAGYSTYFCGAAVGIENGSRVDAAFLDGSDESDLVFSFDRPTDLAVLGGGVVEAADLVRFARGGTGCADWTLLGLAFDGSAVSPPVPATSDVVAADEIDGRIVVAFDVPTTLGAATYLPGQLVSWDGAAFASFYADATWPVAVRAHGASLLSAPGTIPPTLLVHKSEITPGDLRLTWQVSPSVGAEEYGIYEGTLPSWTSHGLKDCFDELSDHQEEITPQSASSYYLVVPNNANGEGSYGRESSGVERAAGVPACRTVQDLGCP